jgi:hypothetical protein
VVDEAAPDAAPLPGRIVARPLRVDERMVLGVTRAEAEADLLRARARLAPTRVRLHADIDQHVLAVEPDTTRTVIEDLLLTGDYAYVEPDWLVHAVDLPNDPQFTDQWHLGMIDAIGAWDITTGNADLVVAICDSGVDTDHPDLAGALVSGYNAVDGLPQSAGGDVEGLTDHGTQVAGTVAAIGNNSIGVTGVCWTLSIMPVRVSNLPNDMAALSDLNAGARWAASNGARIVNVSFSGVTTPTVEETGQFIRDLGGVYVWAAGNAATSLGPADPPSVVIAGATGHNDELAWFSNTGAAIDVTAPGIDILTPNLAGWGLINGTSFSSPTVAGIFGLIWSINPDLSPQAAETIVKETAVDLGPEGEDTTFGAGRVNAAAAAQLALETIDTDLPPIALDDQGGSIDGAVAVIDVLANDIDLTGDAISIESFDATTASGGMVDLVPGPGEDPALAYTPPAEFEGTETFSYTISDEGGQTDDATVTVTSVHAPPFAAPVPIDWQGTGGILQIELADLDADGDLDVVLRTPSTLTTIEVFFNDDGVLTLGPSSALDVIFETRIALTHIDDDGCADLIAVEGLGNEMLVAFGNCDGTFAEPISTTPDQPVDVVAVDEAGNVLDFNADGEADLVVSYGGFQNNFIKILAGDGAGGFTPIGLQTAIDAMGLVAAADFNGDGLTDVAVGGKGFGNVMIGFTNELGQIVGDLQQVPTGSAVRDLIPFDYDVDGDIDLVSLGSGSLSGPPGMRLVENDGTGTFSFAGLVENGASFAQGFTLDDFDADGDVDAAIANGVPANVFIVPGTDAGMQPNLVVPIDTVVGASDAVATDLDGDGDKDLIIGLMGSPNLGNRRIVTIENLADPAPANPADVNGDGAVDVADLIAVILAWGQTGELAEDVDGSGTVDVGDLVAVVLAWG